jgi:beta-xylosidase
MPGTRPTYRNPLYPGYFADPYVFHHEGAYYMVGTGAEHIEADEDRMFPMLRSRDLLNWERLGCVLRRPSPELGADYWAPEIAVTASGFYMYYSVGFQDRLHHIRVATSSHPEGPYDDIGALTRLEELPFAIDGSPFYDGEDWYLYFSVDFLDEAGGARAGTAIVVDRLIDMTRLAGERKTVLRATEDWQRFQANRPMYGATYDWHTLEGPAVLKHEGKFYCFYSGGNWKQSSYGVDYAVAENPMGPFDGGHPEHARVLRTVPGKVIGPGHNSFLTTGTGTTYIVYHAWDTDMTARRPCMDRLEWTEEGPRCVGPTSTPQEIV